jgi:HAE1 family hydrophobic/amphiphilic exporter-1/multidrug efflux pump
LLNLYDALGRVRGVGQVRIFGARDYSMRIWLNPERMARLGVTASDIANVIREQNVVAPAGSLGLPPIPQGQQMQYTVFVKGRLATAAEFENIILREAGTARSCVSRTSPASSSPPPTTRSSGERRHPRGVDRNLPAARRQRARRREADQAGHG